MKRFAPFIVILLLVLFPINALAYQRPQELNPENAAMLADTFFNEEMEDFQVPGAAIVIVKGDEVLYSQGYGFADIKEQIPVSTSETVFRAGSVSKLFTATAVMQLYEQGLLDLDADVNTYLADFQLNSPDGTSVTVAQLLTHTSGLEENYMGMHISTPEEVTPLGDFLASHMPPFYNTPGTIISYNDHSMSLAGYLVEEISGMSFEDYVMENILQPMGMTSSTFSQPIDEALAQRMATGYRYSNGEFSPYAYDYLNVAPAATLISNTDEMAHFMIAHLNNGAYNGVQLLKPETVELMHAQQFTHDTHLRGRAYGFSEWLENDERALFHDGGNPGFMSRLFILPEHGVGFYISINGDQQTRAPRLLREFTSQFFDTFYPETDTEMALPTPPSDFTSRADQYTGYYRDLAGYSSVTLVKFASLISQLPVKANADNTLQIGSQSATEADEHVFIRHETGDYAVFRQTVGEIDYLFIGTGAYQKLAWYEAQPFHLGLVLVFFVGFVAMLLTGILNKKLATSLRTALGGSGLLNLAFLIGLGVVFAAIDQWGILYGIPLELKIVLSLPIIASLFTIWLAYKLITKWKELKPKTWLAILTLIAIGFIPFLNYWNLLGFKQ